MEYMHETWVRQEAHTPSITHRVASHSLSAQACTESLCRLGIKKMVLCGVQTPNCIRACAYDGIALDYAITVLSDATASRSPEAQAANLEGAPSSTCRQLPTATTV